MIHWALLPFLALVIPGFAFLRRVEPDLTRSGALGMLGFSTLAALGLLAPVILLGYGVGLPVAGLALVWVTLVLLGALDLTWQGGWRPLGRSLMGLLGLEGALLGADLVLAGRVGSYQVGDSMLHLARIRQLLDHGLTNADPMVAGGHFFSIYHTNLLHALAAAAARLTGLDPPALWHALLPLAHLWIAAGIYCLAWCLFRRRGPAWAAALFFLATKGPVDFLAYPNKLAPLFLLPILMGLAVRASRSPVRWGSVALLAMGAAAVGMMHGLYGLFAALMLGPLLAGRALVLLWKRAPDRWPAAVCAVVLVLALAFPVVSRWTNQTGGAAGPSDAIETAADRRFVDRGEGRVAFRILQGFGAPIRPIPKGPVVPGLRLLLLAGALAGGWASRRRPEVLRLGALLLPAAAVLYLPPLCSAALAAVGRRWILARLEVALVIGFAALVPGLLVWALRGRIRPAWGRSLLGLAVVALLLPTHHFAKPYRWSDHRAKAMKPLEERRRMVTKQQAMARFLGEFVPAGETVLADGATGLILVSVHDCHLVAPDRGSLGVPDLWRLRRDRDRMLADETPWSDRRRLLERYGIHHVVPRGPLPNWCREHGEKYWRDRVSGGQVVRLRRGAPPARIPRTGHTPDIGPRTPR